MRVLKCLLLWLITATPNAPAQDTPPEGNFSTSECQECHQPLAADLWAQWQAGKHAGTGCTACHGSSHGGALATARADTTCQSCHAGAASHSYATSKHGAINQMDTAHNWQKPLARGNYRVPGCAYCHQHEGEHDDSMAKGLDQQLWVCSGCHSPRFARAHLDNGKRQLEIASLKLKEGRDLTNAAGNPQELAPLLAKLQQHWQHVLLGQGHQSPDYQWWHGQPAMDGDLIYLKDTFRE